MGLLLIILLEMRIQREVRGRWRGSSLFEWSVIEDAGQARDIWEEKLTYNGEKTHLIDNDITPCL